jgi:hypothetical protein
MDDKNDSCRYCAGEGDVELCESVDCSIRNAWYVRHLIQQLSAFRSLAKHHNGYDPEWRKITGRPEPSSEYEALKELVEEGEDLDSIELQIVQKQRDAYAKDHQAMEVMRNRAIEEVHLSEHNKGWLATVYIPLQRAVKVKAEDPAEAILKAAKALEKTT